MGEADHPRTLLVLRHAKAEREPAARDAERPLAPRGERAAAAAGRWLLTKGLAPELVLCSSAVRARQTWEHVRAGLGPAAGRAEVSLQQRLYHADAESLLAAVRETPAEAGTVLIVGHNPAAHQLVADLTGEYALSFPTAALAVVRLAAGWVDAAPGNGALAGYWSPRSGS